MTSQTILIVQKETSSRERLAEFLRKRGYLTFEAASYEEALRLAEEATPGLVLMNGRYDTNGTARFISDLKELNPVWECITNAPPAAVEVPDKSTAPPAEALFLNSDEIVSMIRNAFQWIQKKESIHRDHLFQENAAYYLNALLEHSDDAIFIKDAERKYLFANSQTLTWFNLPAEELLGRPDEEANTPFSKGGGLEKDAYTLLGNCLEEEFTALENGIPSIRKILRIPVRNLKGESIGILGIAKNISEKRAMEERLMHAQKLETIGLLAGGIAHDFNNILGAIVGYAELAKLDAKDGSRERANLTEVLKAAQRAADLVKQILSFSRQNTQKIKPVRIADVISECLQLIRASLPTSIEIRSRIKDTTGVAVIDSTQMHQVLMNLASNAGHAMALRGGQLFIDLESVAFTESTLPPETGLQPGNYLLISVRDTGHGMSEDIQKKIFEPYFTTKEEGVGTGLGLAVVRNIVIASGGAVTVDSRVGTGATFCVYLPRVETETDERTEYVRPAPNGHERILYVDDEGMLADIGKKMFENLGYEVTAETDPIEALNIFKVHPDRFDLVITDQTMPGLTGVELAEHLLKIKPSIPIVICSGFTESPEYEKAGQLGINYFLRKPIVMREFAHIVRKVLDEKKDLS